VEDLSERPVDLREPRVGAALAVDPPAGREHVAALARAVERELPALADHVITCVRTEIAVYRRDQVPLEDLHASVTHNLEALLVGLTADRSPRPEDLVVRRELGTRRASQGLPVDAVIRAYHVGYRELWRALVAAVPEGDAAAMRALLDTATLVWRWVHDVTDAIAAAHAATVRELEARAVGARQRFVELLVRGDVDGTEAARLAATVGLDPSGTFQVTAVRGISGELDAVEAQRELEHQAGAHVAVVRDETLYVVSQDGLDTEVARTCRRIAPAASIAVGATRDGLAGARASLEDGRLALAVTGPVETTRFDDVWLWATLSEDRARLEPLLAVGTDLARRSPHLAEAVRAFAGAGFSVSEAARRLSVHPNTVAYRLERWEELTGWDPRSFEGLVRSVAAVRAV
jgi:hypothetical protein